MTQLSFSDWERVSMHLIEIRNWALPYLKYAPTRMKDGFDAEVNAALNICEVNLAVEEAKRAQAEDPVGGVHAARTDIQREQHD